MAGIDNFTKLMLHCNGVDASTTFTDSSLYLKTVTAYGNAQIDTAQSKFGGASGLFDGLTSTFLSIPDSEDFNFGNGEFTIDFWIKFSNLLNTQSIISQMGAGGGNGSFQITKSAGQLLRFYYSVNGSTMLQVDSSYTFTDTNWHHVAIVRDNDTLRFFVDGIAKGTGGMTGVTIYNSSLPLNISNYGDGLGQPVYGWIDEIRISKGIARWTTTFTPPTEEYTGMSLFVIDEEISVNDNNDFKETIFRLNENININDTQTFLETIFNINENININDSQEMATVITADYGIKILSYNPLIFITDTDPVKIIKVDTTDPNNPIFTGAEIIGTKYAKDIILNSVNNYFYILCNDGLIAKIEKTNFNNQSLIDLEDDDNLLYGDALESLGLTYASTDNIIGELYLIDEREAIIGDFRLDVLAPQKFYGDFQFYIYQSNKMDANLQVLAINYGSINTDFKCLTNVVDNISPLKQSDFNIKIDNVSLSDTDLKLDSITINHTIDDKSNAEFTLTRRHDKLDYDLDNNYRQITNQNDVIITINGIEEFNGKISKIDARYNLNEEVVIITASSNEKTHQYNNITLSLPSLNKRLGLYEVLISNPIISNPYIDPNDSNPTKYKGIKINLGEKRVQNYSRLTVFELFSGLTSIGITATKIQNGTFNSQQNYSYFWGPLTVKKFGNVELGELSNITFNYIGTSLSPITEDLWKLNSVNYKRQRQLDDIITRVGTMGIITKGEIEELKLGIDSTELFNALVQASCINLDGTIHSNFINNIFSSTDLLINYNLSIKNSLYELLNDSVGYYVGEAPYKKINIRNGIFIPSYYWSDQNDGLYSLKEAGYNFEEYGKKIADLEYQKLLNINGTLFPETNVNLNLTIDGYYYHYISLLTRINIDNTTQLGIYNNSNGFPVSVKGITINSSNMQVSITADNAKSNSELEKIDGQYPNEEDEDYNTPEERILLSVKTDMKTRLKVE